MRTDYAETISFVPAFPLLVGAIGPYSFGRPSVIAKHLSHVGR